MIVDEAEVNALIAAIESAAGTLLPRQGVLGDGSAGGPDVAELLASTDQVWEAELTLQHEGLIELAAFLRDALVSFSEADTTLAEAVR